jgi:hypothetical protein
VLFVVHPAIGEVQLEENVLQQRPSRVQPAAGQQDHLELPLAEVLGHKLAQERLAGTCRADHQGDPLGPLDAPHERLPRLLDAGERHIAGGLRSGSKRTLAELKQAFVHIRLGWGTSAVVGASCAGGRAWNRRPIPVYFHRPRPEDACRRPGCRRRFPGR